MENQKQICKILWEKTTFQTARILRVFTTVPIAEIPAHVAGCPVTELGNYCFAPDCRMPVNYLTADIGSPFTVVTELCGIGLESVLLPNTLEKIGDYAFYNCRNLSDITFSSRLQTIGSDAFMNCHKLHQIYISASPKERNGLQKILAQIYWDVEVSFINKSSLNSVNKESCIFYPEYYEAYDEIAPAHIFERKIIGEGFRARQCFIDGTVDFAQYDQIFKKACAEESVQTLSQLAFNRLRYPYHLLETYKLQYTNYILAYGNVLCQQIVQGRRLDDLLFLLREKLLSTQNIQYTLALAAQSGWSEGNASILRWKQLNHPPNPRTKYKFEDF